MNIQELTEKYSKLKAEKEAMSKAFWALDQSLTDKCMELDQIVFQLNKARREIDPFCKAITD